MASKALLPKGVFVTVPEETWDFLHETLQMDSESSSFDRDLRDQIKEALASIEAVDRRKVGKKWVWALKMPADSFDLLYETLSFDAQSKWVDKNLRKQIDRGLDRIEVHVLSPRDWSPRWSGG